MKELPSFQALVDSFSKLPGIGKKSAERMAYAVLEMRQEDASAFAEAIVSAKSKIHKCPRCGLYAEGGLCEVCSDPNRNHSTCIVVSYPKDALAFARGRLPPSVNTWGNSFSQSKAFTFLCSSMQKSRRFLSA